MTAPLKTSKRPKVCRCGSRKVVDKVRGWWKCKKCFASIQALGHVSYKKGHQAVVGVRDVPSGLRGINREVERGFAAFCKRNSLDRARMSL